MSDDTISRQAAIAETEKYKIHSGIQNQSTWNECVCTILETLRELPTAEPQERTGYWIYDGFEHAHGIEWCHCSKCGNRESVDSIYTQVDIYPYCAKCGAKMDSKQILSEADNDTAYGGLMSAT